MLLYVRIEIKIEQGVCERHARSTRRPYHARAKRRGWIARLLFETPKTNHLRRQVRSKSALENPKMDVRSGLGKPKNDKKSTKFRSRALSGALGRLGPLWGRRRDLLGTALGRQQAAPGPISGRPKRAKSAREASKSLPRPIPRRPRTTPEQCLSAFGAPSAVAHACGTIFHVFCVVARKLRCAFRISFNAVLLTSDEISAARARTATTLENQGVTASKIEPGSVRATQNRPRARLFERRNAV